MDSWNEIISRCLRMLNIEEFKGVKLIRFSQLPPGPRRPPCSCAFLSSSRPDRRAGISKGASEDLPCVRLEVLVLGGHFRRISDMLIPLAECRTAPLCRPYPCRIPLQQGAHPCTWAAPCFALPHRGQGFLIKRAETETSRLSGRSGRRPRFFCRKRRWTGRQGRAPPGASPGGRCCRRKRRRCRDWRFPA